MQMDHLRMAPDEPSISAILGAGKRRRALKNLRQKVKLQSFHPMQLRKCHSQGYPEKGNSSASSRRFEPDDTIGQTLCIRMLSQS